MTSFGIAGGEIIVLWPEGGQPKAYDGECPHQGLPLSDGYFDGKVLVCAAHNWDFDGATGNCINPGQCTLKAYPLEIKGEEVLVDLPRAIA